MMNMVMCVAKPERRGRLLGFTTGIQRCSEAPLLILSLVCTLIFRAGCEITASPRGEGRKDWLNTSSSYNLCKTGNVRFELRDTHSLYPSESLKEGRSMYRAEIRSKVASILMRCRPLSASMAMIPLHDVFVRGCGLIRRNRRVNCLVGSSHIGIFSCLPGRRLADMQHKGTEGMDPWPGTVLVQRLIYAIFAAVVG